MNLRRFFGSELAFYRRGASLTQAQLASEVGYSVNTIQSVEQGARSPSDDLCRRLDAVFGLDGVLTRLGKLARSERPGFTDYLAYEGRARRIRTYDHRIVHGLLQTPDYAYALLRDERGVTDRIDRQKRVISGEVRLHSVLDEAVLLRNVGGPKVMRAQLEHLLNQPENVTIQVLPLDADVHPGMDGPLTLLDFDGQPPVAHADSGRGGLFIDGVEDVAVVDDEFLRIVARALTPDLSAEWISAEMEEYRS